MRLVLVLLLVRCCRAPETHHAHERRVCWATAGQLARARDHRPEEVPTTWDASRPPKRRPSERPYSACVPPPHLPRHSPRPVSCKPRRSKLNRNGAVPKKRTSAAVNIATKPEMRTICTGESCTRRQLQRQQQPRQQPQPQQPPRHSSSSSPAPNHAAWRTGPAERPGQERLPPA